MLVWKRITNKTNPHITVLSNLHMNGLQACFLLQIVPLKWDSSWRGTTENICQHTSAWAKCELPSDSRTGRELQVKTPSHSQIERPSDSIRVVLVSLKQFSNWLVSMMTGTWDLPPGDATDRQQRIAGMNSPAIPLCLRFQPAKAVSASAAIPGEPLLPLLMLFGLTWWNELIVWAFSEKPHTVTYHAAADIHTRNWIRWMDGIGGEHNSHVHVPGRMEVLHVLQPTLHTKKRASEFS